MKVYLAKHLQNEIRVKSRSGGAFYALAEHFISVYGGIIYGCAFDISLKKAKHIRVDTVRELKSLQGSKYVQSEIGDAIKLALCDLAEGKKVLFSGTSCQVAGMIAACSDSVRKNLLTVDIVCHGVPSPGIFREWLSEKESSLKEKVVSFDFRNKSKFGWNSHKETIYTKNKEIDSEEFVKLFYGHNIMRPCCYECLFRNTNRISDISLADAWGIEKDRQKFNDNLGVSLVLINTENGAYYFKNTSIEKIEVSLENYMQPPFYQKLQRPADRKIFWKIYSEKGLRTAMKYDAGVGIFMPMRYFFKIIMQMRR